MSVIVKCPDGSIKLYCKGADTVIYERLDSTEEHLKQNLLSHLESFATEGLRTLCCAYTELKKTDYEIWAKAFHKSTLNIVDREGNIN